MPSRSLLAPALVALAACSGGRARDRLADQHPRSEFPETAATSVVRGTPQAPARPVEASADAGAGPKNELRAVRTLAQVVARAVATDEDRVYFGDAGDDGLFAMPKKGGEPVRLARRAPVRGAIAIERGQVAWVGSPGDAVLRVATSGGPTTTLRDRGLFTDVALHGGDLFFTEAASGGGSVTRITGTTTARLAALDASPQAIAVDGEDAFVVAGDKLFRVPRTRGPVSVVGAAAAMTSPVVAEERVFVTAAGAGGEHVVLAIPRSGGQPAPVLHQIRPRSPLAVHAGVLYAVDGERTRLRALTLATGAERFVAEHEALASAVAIAADDSGLYVATDDAGVLLAVAAAPPGG